MSRRRPLLASVVAAVAAGGIALAIARTGDDSPAFDERAVAVDELPGEIRAEVAAHGGGSCVEQAPSVFRCELRRTKQAHEGPSGRVWCFDSDGPRTTAAYPAPSDGRRCSD